MRHARGQGTPAQVLLRSPWPQPSQFFGVPRSFNSAQCSRHAPLAQAPLLRVQGGPTSAVPAARPSPLGRGAGRRHNLVQRGITNLCASGRQPHWRQHLPQRVGQPPGGAGEPRWVAAQPGSQLRCLEGREWARPEEVRGHLAAGWEEGLDAPGGAGQGGMLQVWPAGSLLGLDAVPRLNLLTLSRFVPGCWLWACASLQKHGS